MSDEPLESSVHPGVAKTVNPADLAAHVAKVKAAWREHERGMTWEQKIAVMERMRERSAQLDRARWKMPALRGSGCNTTDPATVKPEADAIADRFADRGRDASGE